MKDTTSERVPGDRLAPLCGLAAEAGIKRSTAWRWLKNGELGKPVKIPGDRASASTALPSSARSGLPTVAGGNVAVMARRADRPVRRPVAPVFETSLRFPAASRAR